MKILFKIQSSPFALTMNKKKIKNAKFIFKHLKIIQHSYLLN